MKYGNRRTKSHPRPKDEVDGRLYNWYRIGRMVAGNMLNHRHYPDGKFVMTDLLDLDKTFEDNYKYIITTHIGTKYVLRKDEHHPTKQDVDKL